MWALTTCKGMVSVTSEPAGLYKAAKSAVVGEVTPLQDT